MVYTLRFFLFKMQFVHKSNVFGSCIIHILYTGVLKFKKNNSGAKRLIARESLQVFFFFFFVLGAVAYLQVSPLGGSRDETWRGQGLRKRSVSWNLPKVSQLWRCNGGFRPCTTYGQNNSWVLHEIPAEWLPVGCETNRPAGAIGRNCRACARNVCQESSEVNTSREPGITDVSVNCLAYSAQTSSRERMPAAAVR